MHCSRLVATLLTISIYLTASYQAKGDDTRGQSLRRYEMDEIIRHWRSSEDKAFSQSRVCAAENRSFVQTCDSDETVTSFAKLQLSQCFCDEDCHKYDDCCMNKISGVSFHTPEWSCKQLFQAPFRIPIYVLQKCPHGWTDSYIKFMCENEATEVEKMYGNVSYLIDVPVKAKNNGVFYRNIFCATCNREADLEKWNSSIFCAGLTSGDYDESSKHKFDFSELTYKAKNQMLKNVKFEGRKCNCRINISDFTLDNLLQKYHARLCKPFISSCLANADSEHSRKCGAYTSFVYSEMPSIGARLVYKNFHCALCNNVSVDNIICTDTSYKPAYIGTGVTLRFLFDFNFEGNKNQIGNNNPCRLSDGVIWDPLMEKCRNFTCGILFERKGSQCIPRVSDNNIVFGLNNSCPKHTLTKSEFIYYRNRSVFIKEFGRLLSVDDYEVNERDGYEVISINICAKEGSFLLHLSSIQYKLSEIALSLSIICLFLHLFVYGSLKELRNCPGKILISLSASLVCGHISLLVGQYMVGSYWMCYFCGVLTHFGYLSSFLWMNVMAYDIYRTFAATKTRASNKKTFYKYSIYSWITAVFILSASVTFDNVINMDNEFRPKYGDPICWFNQRKGLLIFFIIPIFVLLVKNVIFFISTAFRIRQISRETKMVKNFSDNVRYLLYIKLTVVFGLTWLLGILAGILKASFLWYPFILLNGLQGVFIFVAFTVKRKILKMLLIRFKIHSDTYTFVRDGGIKKALYSSLSNLSTLQTTLAVQLPSLNDNKHILKGVRKINPDVML